MLIECYVQRASHSVWTHRCILHRIASLAIFQCYLSKWWACTQSAHAFNDTGGEVDIKKQSAQMWIHRERCCKRLANKTQQEQQKLNNKWKWSQKAHIWVACDLPNNCSECTEQNSQMRSLTIGKWCSRKWKNHRPTSETNSTVGWKKALKCLSTDRNAIAC